MEGDIGNSVKLLVSQGVDRLHPRCFARGVETKKHADAGRHDKSQRHGTQGDHHGSFGNEIDEHSRSDSQEHADKTADHGDHDSLEQKLGEEVALARADRHANPDLAVRSVTDTSIMFMMPIPPTTSDTDAMAPSIRDITRVV